MTLLHRIFRPLASVLCLAACGGGAVSAAAASETTDSAFMRTLKYVEVTATRRPLATTQVLAGPKLQALSSTSVADALKYFAGVQIKDYGGLGGLKTINVRSLGSQHVGVYIDGIRITNGRTVLSTSANSLCRRLNRYRSIMPTGSICVSRLRNMPREQRCIFRRAAL